MLHTMLVGQMPLISIVYNSKDKQYRTFHPNSNYLLLNRVCRMPCHPLPYITSDQTFLAIFECEPIKVYAWVDLKRKLEHNQASDKQTWESL